MHRLPLGVIATKTPLLTVPPEARYLLDRGEVLAFSMTCTLGEPIYPPVWEDGVGVALPGRDGVMWVKKWTELRHLDIPGLFGAPRAPLPCSRAEQTSCLRKGENWDKEWLPSWRGPERPWPRMPFNLPAREPCGI